MSRERHHLSRLLGTQDEGEGVPTSMLRSSTSVSGGEGLTHDRQVQV